MTSVELYGIKPMPTIIKTYNIGSPNAEDVTATLYSDGLLEFDGTGDMIAFYYYDEEDYKLAPWLVIGEYDFVPEYTITSVKFKQGNTIQPTSTSLLFAALSEVTFIDISNLDSSNVTDITRMFGYCPSLTTIIGLDNFNTSSVTDMSFMFSGCTSLESLDLSSFDTSKVTDMSYMFNGCKSLTGSIIIMNSNIKHYEYIFDECSTELGTKFVVNYVNDETKAIAEAMIATKSENSNVVLGELVIIEI